MRRASFSKTVQVLFLYGLRPISWEGDLIILEDPHRNTRLVLSGDPDDEVPVEALAALLEYAALEAATFWQLYETI